MVAIIKTGKGIRRCFQYNENKLEERMATLLLAHNYPKETHQLSFQERLKLLEKMTELNHRTKVNSVHISLNFDPSEQLSKEKLIAIASRYMDGIGFGNQPYLVYQHHDAGHPHLHVVTTNIQLDGTIISLHHLSIRHSEPTRKSIEDVFGLIKAEEQKKNLFTLKPIPLQQLKYGKLPIKRAINSILQGILFDYKYTSIPELNSILNLYHVKANRGTEQSRIFKNQGLVYQIIDDKGKALGVPIKASLFAHQPILRMLNLQFTKNEKERLRFINATKAPIDLVLKNAQIKHINDFKEELKTKGIDVVFRQNEQGVIYGITYVNHISKCVFNGSTLGKNYSAKGITEQLKSHEFSLNQGAQKASEIPVLNDEKEEIKSDLKWKSSEGIIETLLQSENTYEPIPYTLKGKKKKKKTYIRPN